MKVSLKVLAWIIFVSQADDDFHNNVQHSLDQGIATTWFPCTGKNLGPPPESTNTGAVTWLGDMERCRQSQTSFRSGRKATPRTIRPGLFDRGQGPVLRRDFEGGGLGVGREAPSATSVESLCVRFSGLSKPSSDPMREDPGIVQYTRPCGAPNTSVTLSRPFAGFFEEGSIGRCLFPFIRSFLQVDDLVTLSKTCFVMNHSLARTCTVAEILRERGHTNMTEQRRIVIAIKVRSSIKYGGRGDRPQRVTQGDRGLFWANLYHPDHELDRIHGIIDSFGLRRPANATLCPRYGKDDGSFYGFFYSEVDAKRFTVIWRFLTVSDIKLAHPIQRFVPSRWRVPHVFIGRCPGKSSAGSAIRCRSHPVGF